MKLRYLMWVLWPSFLVAILASAVIFTFIDPADIRFFGYATAGRMTVYAAGFFLFWLLAALSSAYTLKLSPKGKIVDDFGEPIK